MAASLCRHMSGMPQRAMPSTPGPRDRSHGRNPIVVWAIHAALGCNNASPQVSESDSKHNSTNEIASVTDVESGSQSESTASETTSESDTEDSEASGSSTDGASVGCLTPVAQLRGIALPHEDRHLGAQLTGDENTIVAIEPWATDQYKLKGAAIVYERTALGEFVPVQRLLGRPTPAGGQPGAGRTVGCRRAARARSPARAPSL